MIAGAILTGLGVAVGAFGAHGLNDILIENGRKATFETGVRFQFYHSLGLLAIGLISKEFKDQLIGLAASFILIGTLIFSISLYVLSLTNIGWLGAITPFGGTAMLIGWSLLVIGLIRDKVQ